MQKMASIERESQPGGAWTTPRAKPSSWRLDLHLPLLAPRRVIMKCTNTKDLFVVGGLTPTATVEELRSHVRIRMLCGPHTHIIIEHHGRELVPSSTLVESALQDDAKLNVRVVERRPTGERGLQRLRVTCTALATRIIEIDSQTIRGLAFKELLEVCIGRPAANGGPDGPFYNWWDSEGELFRIQGGQALVSLQEMGEVENTGTSAVKLGEEIIIDSHQSASLRGGKGTVTGRRMATGKPATVSADMVAFLELVPPKMKLSFCGVEIKDGDSLYALGCRTDDVVELEFESPAVPPILTLLRAPVQEKAPKEKKGGKKKK